MLSAFIVTLFAQVPVSMPGDDPFGWLLATIKWMIEQFQNHNIAPAVGALIMVLVFLFRLLLESKVNKKWLPWVSAGIGVLLQCAANLAALAAGWTHMDWLSAVLAGLTTGAAASGLWSMLGKTLSEKFLNKSADPAQ